MELYIIIFLAFSSINLPAFLGFTIWYFIKKRNDKKEEERKKKEMELNADFLYLQKEKGNYN